MADNSSWYARKIAQMKGVAPPYPQARQPVSRYQQPVERPYQQNPEPPPRAPAAPPETLTEFLDLQRNGQALGPAKGGKLNPDPCPQCGGNLFYADLGLKRRGPTPAPHCFTCGYNEMFEQGLESNWQGGS